MMLGYFAILYVVVGLCDCFGEPPAAEEEEYVLNFDSPVYVCPDEASQEFLATDGAEVARHNETVAVMRGRFSFLKQLEPCTLIEFIVEKNKNGRTQVLVTHEICDFCAEMGPESNYYKYFKFFGFPDACPLEPGEIAINDFIADSDDLPVNKANEGSYQVTLNFYKDLECDCKNERLFLGCVKLDFLIEPL